MERTGVQIANLIIQMVLARLLVPEDFAAVAIVTVFISIANIFVQSGLGTALIQSKDVTEEDYSTVFYTSLSISVLIPRYFIYSFTKDSNTRFPSKESTK